MPKLRFFTAGESHGQGLVGTLEGLPANTVISIDKINHQLWRRQQGYGRGRRMQIESDKAQILTGVRHGKSLGSPISLFIENRDWKNWEKIMAVEGEDPGKKLVEVPRPGHADLSGAIKYNQTDMRNILERASARETTTRVALGAIARQFIDGLGIGIASHVLQIADVKSEKSLIRYGSPQWDIDLQELNERADNSPVRCIDSQAEAEMIALIDKAKEERDTCGGIFEVAAYNLPVGLGSHVHWDRRLDAQIAAAMMGIQAMKGVEIGDGFGGACRFGSQVHDEIYYREDSAHFYRKQNNAGGLEGGITNGMPLVVRVAMKPIATLMRPLDSVELESKKPVKAHVERSDVTAVPAAAVIGEAMLALVLADAVLDKFGGDSFEEVENRYLEWIK
ncbi:MAG: chorismate synthase [Calditrichaeota bacterium]|nr:MAG: chorismate synthase [Calditrichota bacterium]